MEGIVEQVVEENIEDKAPANYVIVSAQGMLKGVMEKTDLDYEQIDFDSLKGIESLIREMTHRRRISSLIVALAVLHIRNRHLYPEELTWVEYRRTCKDRMGIATQDVWRYERIGEAYCTYYHDLQKIGFDVRGGGTTKLMMIPQATAKFGRVKAITEFARLGLREYAAWVKDRPVSIPYRSKEFGVTNEGLTYRRQIVIRWKDITAIAQAGKLDRLKAAIAKLKRGG